MVGGYDYFVSLVVCVLDPFYGVGEFGGCGDFSEGGELDEGFVVANMCSGCTYTQVIHRLWITFRAGKGRIVPSNFSSRVKYTGRTCDNFMVVVLVTII